LPVIEETADPLCDRESVVVVDPSPGHTNSGNPDLANLLAGGPREGWRWSRRATA